MAWQLEGEDRILAWLEASSHAPTKEAVLAWVARLLAIQMRCRASRSPASGYLSWSATFPTPTSGSPGLSLTSTRVVRITEVFEP